jgi:hypothetical protein
MSTFVPLLDADQADRLPARARELIEYRHETDPGTLARVLERLRGQLADRPVPAVVPFSGPAEPLEHRTCTLLTSRIRRQQ